MRGTYSVTVHHTGEAEGLVEIRVAMWGCCASYCDTSKGIIHVLLYVVSCEIDQSMGECVGTRLMCTLLTGEIKA